MKKSVFLFLVFIASLVFFSSCKNSEKNQDFKTDLEEFQILNEKLLVSNTLNEKKNLLNEYKSLNLKSAKLFMELQKSKKGSQEYNDAMSFWFSVCHKKQKLETEIKKLELNNAITQESNYSNNNEVNNSNINYQSNNSSSSINYQLQNTPLEKRKCSYCDGTGNCPKCSVPQNVRYKQGESPDDHKEIRLGMIVCPQCGGNLMNFGADKNKSCYLCKATGWIKCPECNYNNIKIGKCGKCEGTGISK